MTVEQMPHGVVVVEACQPEAIPQPAPLNVTITCNSAVDLPVPKRLVDWPDVPMSQKDAVAEVAAGTKSLPTRPPPALVATTLPVAKLRTSVESWAVPTRPPTYEVPVTEPRAYESLIAAL